MVAKNLFFVLPKTISPTKTEKANRYRLIFKSNCGSEKNIIFFIFKKYCHRPLSDEELLLVKLYHNIQNSHKKARPGQFHSRAEALHS